MTNYEDMLSWLFDIDFWEFDFDWDFSDYKYDRYDYEYEYDEIGKDINQEELEYLDDEYELYLQ